jgi:hypothetical protein
MPTWIHDSGELGTVEEPARRLEVAADTDVLVCGGGPAGYCAAIAAAREGARTTLVEASGLPGGSAVQALVLPLMTFHAAVDLQVVAGIGEELVQEVRSLGGSPGHLPDPLGCAATVTPVDPEILKVAVVRLLARAGVRVRLHTLVAATLRRDDAVTGVVIEDKTGRRVLRARVVVDATGDGDVAARAGATFSHGRAADGLAQPLTWMFRLGGVDGAAVRRAIRDAPDDFVLSDVARSALDDLPCLGVAGFFSLVRAAQAGGRLGEFRDRVLYFELPSPGEVMVNMTRIAGRSGVDADSLSVGALAAFEQVQEVFAFLRADVPGFQAAHLLQVAPRVGVRESRHVAGDYTLTAEDVVAGRDFPDGVARGAFPIDIHSPDGAGLEMIKMAPGTSYSIPFRCMLPRGLEGLLVTGRAISASHEASASARLSPTCMALGEAAGLAAALAVSEGVHPRQIDAGRLRERLADRGAVV